MQEFRQYLMDTVGTIEWQDAEKCKAAAKDIMDQFHPDEWYLSSFVCRL